MDAPEPTLVFAALAAAAGAAWIGVKVYLRWSDLADLAHNLRFDPPPRHEGSPESLREMPSEHDLRIVKLGRILGWVFWVVLVLALAFGLVWFGESWTFEF
jgi:hypothetical protein